MSKYFTTSEVAQNPDAIFWLEKGQTGKTTIEDIQDALAEYKNNYDAGNASKAEILTLHRAFPDSPTYKQAAVGIQKMDMVDPMVIGGPASVEMIDREGHLITTPALSKAFKKFMDNQRTRNVMVLHSDVQVGWALPAYISRGGQIFKSGVGEGGLFFICELRDDTAIAKKVADQIGSGLLKSYSIAGSATKVQNMMKGQTPYMQVDEMELAEVTICEKGVNQGAGFELLKAELPQTGKIDKDQCGYRDATAPEEKMGINCGHCKYFNSDTRTCDVVVGDIMPGDYCQLFDAVEEEKPPIQVHRKIVIMRSENTGKINFGDSFLNWMSKNEDPLKSGKSFTTLNNITGREAEHHRLLQRYGFPSEVDTDKMRYIPVAETETDDDGIPINVKPPWVVNEAGENLGERLDNDDIKKSIDIFEAILQKATKRMDKANPGQAYTEGETPDKTGEEMGVSAWKPQVNYGAPNPYNVQNPAGSQQVQTEQGRRNESPIGAGQAALGRDYPNNPPLPTKGPSQPWHPSGEQSTAASSSNKAPFPALTPQGVAAQAGADAEHKENLRTGGSRLDRARERSEGLTRQVPEREAAAAREKISDRREHLKRFGGTVTPEGTYDPTAKGRQARTPVEEQGRRQLEQGPAIQYRGRKDEASKNRADAVREARQARGQYVDPDAKDIVTSAQSKGRRAAYENRSAGDRFKQGLKQFGRETKQQVRGAVRGFKDEKPTMNDEKLPEGRGIGRGARRAAEGARGAFRGFMNPREESRPDLPVSDQPASVLGETDNRLGAGSRERGGQVGRMARQWLGRGARGAKGAVGGFLENPEDARRVGPTKRYTPDEVGATGRQADVAGMRGRGAGAKLRGFLDEKVGRGQALAGEGADMLPKYGRNAQQQNRMGATEGLGKDVRYSPTDHQGMDTDQKHNHVQERLDHINQGGNLSPKDWMSVVHHLGQTEDGDRFAQHHSINMKGDDWNKPISFADMRQHLDRNMQVHHGRHGGAGAEAYDGILNRLGDSHEFGREITLKRLRGGRPSMEGLGGGQGQQGEIGEMSPEVMRDIDRQAQRLMAEKKNQGRRSPNPMDIRGDNPERPPRERGNAGRGRGQRGRGRAKLRQERQARQAGRKAPQQNEQQYYSIENDMPIHKIFAKAFGLAATRR
jgi:hypothetical protein